jgi:DNA polymerase
VITVHCEPTFDSWRAKARELLGAGIHPNDVLWTKGNQGSLFQDWSGHTISSVSVPRGFLEAAAVVSCHREERKWPLLYRILYRLAHGEPELLAIATDADVHDFSEMYKQVAHEMHRMKAFVRFREVSGRYVAWYEPDHLIVPKVAPWFTERFGNMTWSILTPDVCAHWDQKTLAFSPGLTRSAAPVGDGLEELWRTYYASTFNPARVNLELLRTHMPVRKWKNLPEARLIEDLSRRAAERTGSMVGKAIRSAVEFVPANATLPVLREAVASCRACELYECATQAVFGEGPSDARIAFVGEQPGDNEDREGRPFVGPAGQLFDRALADAGLVRSGVYVTGAVKHFRYEERGKRRIHKTASKAQVAACQPWLEAELALVRPRVIVCMGNTAVLSVLGRGVRLMEERGKIMPHRNAAGVLVTVHPGFLLRMPDEVRRAQEYDRFVEDIRTAQLAAIA